MYSTNVQKRMKLCVMVRGQDARINQHEDQGRKLFLIRFIQPIQMNAG